jgi:hypothetical protein
MPSRHVLSAVAALALASCSRSDSVSRDAVVEHTTIGDTTIVRTVSGSVWGDTARLVEEVRIGALDGPEELTFGRIGQLAQHTNGTIDIFDSQAIALRRFDSAGAFVKKIGGRGQGPGEYEMLLGLRALSDDRLVAYDGRNQRITSFSPTGDLLETWPLQLSIRMFSDNSFAVDQTDHMYVLTARSRTATGTAGAVLNARPRTATGPAAGPAAGPAGGAILLRIAPGGQIVDTLDVPRWTTDPASRGVCLAPGGRWVMHPSGQFVAGVTDKYSIDLRQPSGKVVRIQRAVEPVAFESGERAELEADIAGGGQPIESVSITAGKPPVIEYGARQTVPAVKPIFRNLLTGSDGRIWVQLHTRAEEIDPATETVVSPCNVERKAEAPSLSWREAIVWDVFEEDGRYLGVVAVPPRTTLRTMSADRVWAVQRGANDEEYVVRYRIAPPAIATRK